MRGDHVEDLGDDGPRVHPAGDEPQTACVHRQQWHFNRALVIDPGVGAHAVRPGGPHGRREYGRIRRGVHRDRIRVPRLVGLRPVMHCGAELFGGGQPLRVGVDVVDLRAVGRRKRRGE